jgi:hypothetical protein
MQLQAAKESGGTASAAAPETGRASSPLFRPWGDASFKQPDKFREVGCGHIRHCPDSFEVALKDGLYQGAAALKQTEFGITPVKVAGGTVKVKDEVKIAFSIALLN